MPALRVEVRDDEIIVTQAGSKFRAVYHKPDDQPQLIAKGTPHANYDFLAQAWVAANGTRRASWAGFGVRATRSATFYEQAWQLGDVARDAPAAMATDSSVSSAPLLVWL